jgi:hypothetical protein
MRTATKATAFASSGAFLPHQDNGVGTALGNQIGRSLGRAAVICGAEAYPFSAEAASAAFVRCEIMARCFSLSAA